MDNAPGFDPFNNRLARDIRNTLSEAFATALQCGDFGAVEQAAKRWAARDLPAGHAAYLDDRMQNYRGAMQATREQGLTDPLAQAVLLWNRGLYFELHDLLEAVWLRSGGKEREALQGLIKAAGVYIHLEYRRSRAAEGLAPKAAALLRRHRGSLYPIKGITDLTERLERNPQPPPKLEIAAGFREAPGSNDGAHA
jgi:predicted metal-dependent hydrolase